MTQEPKAQAVIVMGVSGVGKTTIARGLADHFGGVFIEGDDLHPPENIATMAQGTALDDDMRAPWLASLGAAIATQMSTSRRMVFATCSALKRSYRDVLRDRVPDVVFLYLDGNPDSIKARIKNRNNHFMPTSLLASQLSTFEELGNDEAHLIIKTSDSAKDTLSKAIHALAG